MSISTAPPEYAAYIQKLLKEIDHRYIAPPAHDAAYWAAFHHWMTVTLPPTCSWSAARLAELEHAAGGLGGRFYPYACTELKLVVAKLSVLGFIIDDSIQDDAVQAQLLQFTRRFYLGQPQREPILVLFDGAVKELSDFYGDDSVLRGLAVAPWITFIDASLMEKNVLDAEVRAWDHPRPRVFPLT